MKRLTHIILFALLLGSAPSIATTTDSNKAAAGFYRIGEWVDKFHMRGLDTAYIGLPEFNWRVALTAGGTGIHATYTTWVDAATPIALRSQTTPSLDLGFNVSFCGYGGGYSWDVLNAYTTNWNISFGSKVIGIEFLRNVSTNLTGQFVVDGKVDPSMPALNKGEFRISNTSLSAWYALNAAHYSHNAAANMQVVCYSVNHVSYMPPTGVYLPGEPQYVLRPTSPVHVAGNVRAAVSWEINQWVHLSAWAQANNLSFTSKTGDMSTLGISNWHWKAHLNVGVRFGSSKQRRRQVPGEPEPTAVPAETKQSNLPQWVTDYFFSSMQ